jgi:FAD/FMN-containing dehydrogenase
VADGALVIDVRRLDSLDIDAEGRTAWAGSGLTAGSYTRAAGAHGLATGFGDTGSVGVAGLTTGGGIGFLVRRHGLTVDSLLAAEIVTADGEIRVVDEQHEPDLFWAIRGGGGNFGVLTRFRFRLVPVDPFVGGILVLPATADVVASFIEQADAAPEGLSTIANVMTIPPMPFVPEEHHGTIGILAFMAWVGPVDEGERVMASFRALATPIADLVKPMAYHEMYSEEEEEGPPVLFTDRTMFLERVDRPVAQTMLDHLAASEAPMRAVQLRVLGGAMARIPADETAFALRDRRILTQLAVVFMDEAERPTHEAWINRLADTLHQVDGAYVNFLGEDGAARIREAYPGTTYDRLATIKQRYDPTNLFRHNQNIKSMV